MDTTNDCEDEAPDDVHDRGGAFVEDDARYVRTGQEDRQDGELSIVGIIASVRSVSVLRQKVT